MGQSRARQGVALTYPNRAGSAWHIFAVGVGFDSQSNTER